MTFQLKFSIFDFFSFFFRRKKSGNKKLSLSFDVEFPQDSISDSFGTFRALLKAATSIYTFLMIHFFFLTRMFLQL